MLELKNITKVYGTASEEVKALKAVQILYQQNSPGNSSWAVFYFYEIV